MMAAKRKKKNKGLIIFMVSLFTIIIAALIAYRFYKVFFIPSQKSNAELVLFIPTGSSYEDVVSILKEAEIIKNEETFNLLAKKMNLPRHIHSGRYVIPNNSSIYQIIRKIRSGESDPVMVSLDQVATIEEMCGLAGKMLEIDSSQLMDSLTHPAFLQANDIRKEELLTLFIPDTYEFYWEVSLPTFLKKMKKIYDKFWTNANLKKAEKLNLTPSQVYTLASIVQEEAVVKDEMPRIAGVYLNRLRKGMALQADPTIKFIVRNRRDPKVTLDDYKIESPYNTYLNKGLPPGPIFMTSRAAIESVLNAEKHNYIYFCAKADRSGYHEFTDNYQKHLYYRNLYLKSKQK
ncbi:MAG: endolytic transglycosylase MltG [Sphingobacteriales bacterium]|nr:endolytic transglycosylase MltG [Sphingobacteriales bacterium]